MKDFQYMDHIQTAIAVIDANMMVVDSNKSFKERHSGHCSSGNKIKCFNAAYNFKMNCCHEESDSCPVKRSFISKKSESVIHHYWIEDHAVVEEVTTTPVIEDNGEVNYVIEEYRDITKLLGLNKGIISICSYCRKIRDDDGSWVSFEVYLEKHTGAQFSHGLCNECNDDLRSEFLEKKSP